MWCSPISTCAAASGSTASSTTASYANWAGLVAFLIGLVVSVLLFSNQEKFVGYVAGRCPQLGDITFFVGFLLAGGRLPRAVPLQDRCRTAPSYDAASEML